MPEFVHDEPCGWTDDDGKRCGRTPTANPGDIYYACEEHLDDYADLLDGESWGIEDYLKELEMQVSALQTDLTDNHPDGGPNYGYALGDLRSIHEVVEGLLDEVSVTIRIREDYFREDAASSGREARVPKDIETVRELHSILDITDEHRLVRILSEDASATSTETGGVTSSLGSPDEPVVISDGDQFALTNTPAEN